MNTPTDHLDDQIRTLVRTAVAHSGAPSVDDIERGIGVTIAPAADVRHLYRWIAVAAVMLLALTGALVLTHNRESATTPANPPPSADTRPSLRTYMLPATTPTGWQLVDISEQAGQEQPRAALYEIAARQGGDHAILMISAATSDPAATESAEATNGTASTNTSSDPQWTAPHVSANGELDWIVAGRRASLFVPGANETLARAIQAQLDVTNTGGRLTPNLADSADYQITGAIDDASANPAGSASLTYRYTDGSLINVSLNQTTSSDIDVLLDPTVVNAPPVVRTQNPSSMFGSLVRDNITVRLSWLVSSADAANEVESFLASFHDVTHDEWTRTAQNVTDLIGNQPTIATADLLDGTLTIHQGSTLAGVCFATNNAHGCRYTSVAGPDQSGPRFTSASLIVGGAWIYIRELSNHEAQQPISSNIPDRLVDQAATPIGNFIVASPPPGTNDFTLAVGTGAAATTEQATRPLH